MTESPSTTEPGSDYHSEQPHHHQHRSFLTRWSAHPAVASGDDLTVGERAADKMRNGMGSWGFVFSSVAFLAAWMLYNRNTGFDKYPFILLNLVLSCLAAMQGAILLIAAKRSDQISSQLAEHDYQTDARAAQRIEELHVRLQELSESNQRLLVDNNVLLQQLIAKTSG